MYADILMGELIKLLESSNWSLCGASVSLTKTYFPEEIHAISRGHSKITEAHLSDLLLLCSPKHTRSRLFRRSFIFPTFLFVCALLKHHFSKSPLASRRAEQRCIFKPSILIGALPVMSWFHLPARTKKHFIPASLSLFF